MVLASLLPVRGAGAVVLSYAAGVGIFLLFFLHGARLSSRAIVEGARNWPLHLAVFATTYGLFPLLGLGLAAAPLFTPEIAAGLLFMCLLPSTVQSSIAFTSIARGNVAAAVCSASFSNLAGIFVTPVLVAAIMQREGQAIPVSFEAARTIFLQLLLPFGIGHASRRWIDGWVERNRGLVGTVDRVSILLVVYSAFSAAVVDGLWQRLSFADFLLICAASTLLLIVVLAATSLAGTAMRMPREDRIVLLFCGSKKSLASGVPLAGVLFAPAVVGAIILPLMIFHQIQLVVCALIARRLGDPAQARH